MKLRTTAIAMAVAGIVAAPVAVQAGADEVYASARVGLKYTDTEGTADFDVKSFASRFGMRGETDLGNGMTGFGRYEFGVNSAESGSNTITSRHVYVGLKGDFGSVLVGQTYHTFYNFVVGPLDNPWWHSTGTMVEAVGRTPGAITYAGGAGAVNFGATVHFFGDDEETAPDAMELGASFAVGDSTIGVAYRSVDEDGAVQGQGNGTDETSWLLHGMASVSVTPRWA
jgi:predicted porin